MYAAIFQTMFDTRGSVDARGRTGHSLATALAALPGFLAFVALDGEEGADGVSMLCLFEDGKSIAAVEGAVREWQEEHASARGAIRWLGMGAVIAQKGL